MNRTMSHYTRFFFFEGIPNTSHIFPLLETGEILEEIVEGDAQTRELEDVGEHRDWRQVLEVPDTDQAQHGYQ